MDKAGFETMGNTFGGNNYSNDYSNTMSIDQTYQNGMANNLYSMDNLSNMMSINEANMNNGRGLGMMSDLL